MKNIHKTAVLPYSAEQVYNLVSDISAYPEFLPWCVSAKLESEENSMVTASVTVGHVGLQKTFMTKNKMLPYQKIDIHLVEGPFKSLLGAWSFEALSELKSRITLDLSYEFSAGWMSVAFSSMVSQAARSLMTAFIKRAKALYS